MYTRPSCKDITSTSSRTFDRMLNLIRGHWLLMPLAFWSRAYLASYVHATSSLAWEMAT